MSGCPWLRCLSILPLSLLAAASLAAPAADGEGPPARAYPRIEAGQHTAPIRRIGVDRAGRWLVTASDDKTARVWDLRTGELLRVLRPPIGDGNEGKLNAAAMSPDGGTFAVGGWDVNGPPSNIYIFDREGGGLRHRIGGLPNGVLHLAFAPDGGRLVAALGGGEGIRVYRTADWQEIGRNTDYGSSSYWAAFDGNGRLATSCWDGFIRLYAPDLRQIAKRKAPGGKQPFGISISPDGRRIAVGFRDSTAVNVLSGKDLDLLYAPDTSGIDNGSLNSVAWSKDGGTLYAGGRCNDSQGVQLLTWSDGGRGSAKQRLIATDAIMDLVTLTNGRLVFGSAALITSPAKCPMSARSCHRAEAARHLLPLSVGSPRCA